MSLTFKQKDSDAPFRAVIVESLVIVKSDHVNPSDRVSLSGREFTPVIPCRFAKTGTPENVMRDPYFSSKPNGVMSFPVEAAKRMADDAVTMSEDLVIKNESTGKSTLYLKKGDSVFIGTLPLKIQNSTGKVVGSFNFGVDSPDEKVNAFCSKGFMSYADAFTAEDREKLVRMHFANYDANRDDFIVVKEKQSEADKNLSYNPVIKDPELPTVGVPDNPIVRDPEPPNIGIPDNPTVTDPIPPNVGVPDTPTVTDPKPTKVVMSGVMAPGKKPIPGLDTSMFNSVSSDKDDFSMDI